MLNSSIMGVKQSRDSHEKTATVFLATACAPRCTGMAKTLVPPTGCEQDSSCAGRVCMVLDSRRMRPEARGGSLGAIECPVHHIGPAQAKSDGMRRPYGRENAQPRSVGRTGITLELTPRMSANPLQAGVWGLFVCHGGMSSGCLRVSATMEFVEEVPLRAVFGVNERKRRSVSALKCPRTSRGVRHHEARY